MQSDLTGYLPRFLRYWRLSSIPIVTQTSLLRSIKMKLLNWVALIAMNLAIMFIAMENPTWAADSIRQPASAVQTAYEYDSYTNTDSSQARLDAIEWADTKKSQETPAAEQPCPNPAQETAASTQICCPAPARPAQTLAYTTTLFLSVPQYRHGRLDPTGHHIQQPQARRRIQRPQLHERPRSSVPIESGVVVL